MYAIRSYYDWQVHDLDVWLANQTLPAIEIQVGLLIAELESQVQIKAS